MVHSSLIIGYFIFTTSFILVHIPFSNGSRNRNDNENYYQICSSHYASCGRIRNLSYPFSGGKGDDRPDVCGASGFKLRCWDRELHMFEGDRDIAYEVRSINTSSDTNTMLVRPSKNKICGSGAGDKDRTFHVSPHFKLDANVANLSLFYGCSPSLVSKHNPKSFVCTALDASPSLYYFENMSPPETGKCIGSITVTVLRTELDKLNDKNNTNTSLESALNKPFKVEYNIDKLRDCSTCQNSRGACGSSGSPDWKFVCHCPNGSQQSLTCSISDKRNLGMILRIGIPGVTITLIALATFWYCKKLKSGHSNSLSRSNSLTPDLEHDSRCFGVPLFSYRQLEEATDNFHQSRELGSGGFGRVYYGKVRDGREVAVKRLYEKSYRRVEQFMNEVQILTCLRHQNLVTLYGCTSPNCRELLLVYEFVPNGTVADHLYGREKKALSSGSASLPWPARLRIAIETASALSYLHASDIIHRDVKTCNILLDRNFAVKVADFGLSRLFPNDVTHISTAPQGTPGYLDPEYHQCYQLTVKSDVYSFGVVLVELISSLPAVDMNRVRHEINLSHYAMNRIQRCAFDQLVDPKLGFESDFKVRRMTTSVAELAFQCLQHDKEFRPSMNEVLEVLERIESADYEAMKNEDGEVESSSKSLAPASPTPTEDDDDDDDATLLRTHHHLLHPRIQSPHSVMDKWNSRSTTSSTSSKQGGIPFTI